MNKDDLYYSCETVKERRLLEKFRKEASKKQLEEAYDLAAADWRFTEIYDNVMGQHINTNDSDEELEDYIESLTEDDLKP